MSDTLKAIEKASLEMTVAIISRWDEEGSRRCTPYELYEMLHLAMIKGSNIADEHTVSKLKGLRDKWAAEGQEDDVVISPPPPSPKSEDPPTVVEVKYRDIVILHYEQVEEGGAE